MSAVRLDKYLAQSGERTRSEAVKAIRSGLVHVNGVPVRDPSSKVQDGDEVLLSGQPVGDDSLQYFLFHKPAGVLTAARDSRAETVMDLVPEALSRRKVLPVGRLDKDTTGLLILTNDGALAHSLLDPKRHVWKRYIAQVEGRLDEADVKAFREGIELKDFTARPAQLRILEAQDDASVAEVEVREGKFHQVKRMFGARGHEVTALHRAAFGPIVLPEELKQGDIRRLTEEELRLLRQAIQTAASDEGKENDSNAQ